MSVQAAVTGQPYKNNGGVMKKAGSADTSAGQPITKSRTIMDDAVTTPYGSKVVLSSGSTGSSGNIGTFNAKTTFAYKMVPGRYIMKKRTAYVNGVANDYLTSGASESSERMRAIPFIESARSLGSGVSTSWSYTTGKITKGAGAGESRSFGLDHAARPTNAIPGELVYKTGAKQPIQDDYHPKKAP